MKQTHEFLQCEKCGRTDTTDEVSTLNPRVISWHCHECGHTTTADRREINFNRADEPQQPSP